MLIQVSFNDIWFQEQTYEGENKQPLDEIL